MEIKESITESTPAVEIVKIMILQRLNDLYDSIELYNKETGLGINSNKYSLVKSRLLTLFLQIQPVLKRKLQPKDYAYILDKCSNPKTIADVMEITFTLSEFIDLLKVTRIDFKEKYDVTDILASNKRRGLG